MRKVAAAVFTGILVAALALPAAALSLGPDEFVVANELTCIMAQDALGYLSTDDYDQLVDSALQGYDEAGGDVVYAKALGYFDGLMFGIPQSAQHLINERLRAFNASQACSGLVNSSLQL